MRRIGKIPRVLSVRKIEGLLINVVFKNGEERVIDFNQVFDKLKISAHSPISKLRNPSAFMKVRVANYTLSWDNVDQFVVFNKKKIKIPFEIGADVLYNLSAPIPIVGGVGQMMKDARAKAGLSQEEVAERSGTTRTYISKIENNQSGIEVDTLKRIVEIGLGATLDISIGSGKRNDSLQAMHKNGMKGLRGATHKISRPGNRTNDIIKHSVRQFGETHGFGQKNKFKKSSRAGR